MATPLRFKYKWPTEQKKAGTNISDFVPYVSNIANMFARTPNPTAPTLINPVVGSKISLANSRAAIDNEARAADLSTQGLDAQTGAAIRVGNMANRLRALSDVNSREALANAQITNQSNAINANINAQNAGMINQYHDELTNAQLTRNRLASENLANAADKYIGQQAVKDQMQLEKDKANILSKAYNPGVFSRLLDKLQATGTNTADMGTVPQKSSFDQFRNMNLPAYKGPGGAPITSPSTVPVTMDQMPENIMTPLKKYLKQRNTYAAGGLMNVFSGDPKPKTATPQTPNAPQDAGFNSNDMVFSDPMTRNARIADMMNQIVAEGYHPFNSSQGRAANSQLGTYFNPQFVTDFTTRALQLQTAPGYNTMTPEQRLQQYYNTGRGGTSELDKFLNTTSSYGGGPSAFYQNSPMKPRAAGGRLRTKFNYAMGGKMIKPFC